jgi:hypothetical protein
MTSLKSFIVLAPRWLNSHWIFKNLLESQTSKLSSFEKEIGSNPSFHLSYFYLTCLLKGDKLETDQLHFLNASQLQITSLVFKEKKSPLAKIPVTILCLKRAVQEIKTKIYFLLKKVEEDFRFQLWSGWSSV